MIVFKLSELLMILQDLIQKDPKHMPALNAIGVHCVISRMIGRPR